MASLHPVFFLVTVATIFSASWFPVSASDNLGIVGGHTISIEDAPYMVSLFHERELLCGGSIIDEWFILTAAHCVERNATYQVLIGSDNLNMGGFFIEVEQVNCHDGYDSSTTSTDDICLMKLARPIPIGCGGKVAKIDLPDPDFVLSPGIMVNVTGWGDTKNKDELENSLRQTTVPIVGHTCCKRIYNDLTDAEICAGARGHDSCQGDSGGPLTYNNVQIGIVSSGIGCAVNPGLYTRVASYLDWIHDKMNYYKYLN